MHHAVKQRLIFIECLLANQKCVSRKTLMDYFGISQTSATRDLARYLEIAPENMVLNQSDKLYYRTECFKRVVT